MSGHVFGVREQLVDFFSGCLGVGILVTAFSVLVRVAMPYETSTVMVDAGLLAGCVTAGLGLVSRLGMYFRAEYHRNEAQALSGRELWKSSLDHADKACFLSRKGFWGQIRGLQEWRVAFEEDICEQLSLKDAYLNLEAESLSPSQKPVWPESLAAGQSVYRGR